MLFGEIKSRINYAESKKKKIEHQNNNYYHRIPNVLLKSKK